jgi:hypothetical protein
MFTSPWSTDRENEFFTKDSDYDLEDRLSIRALWHHGLDKTITEPLGRATYSVQDEGIFAQLKLKNDEVGNRIFKLAERGELAWSSGSSSHQVRKEQVGSATWLRVWPITELSVLPATAAAEPRARVQALKSLSIKPLIGSSRPQGYYKDRAREIYVDLLKSQYERQRAEFERSQYADAKSEECAYYSAMAELAAFRARKSYLD